MKKMNCWEFKKCGREKGGANSDELGVCPAALPSRFDGVNDGKYAGRFCWFIKNTLCLTVCYEEKMVSCLQCDFCIKVREEESVDFALLPSHIKNKV